MKNKTAFRLTPYSEDIRMEYYGYFLSTKYLSKGVYKETADRLMNKWRKANNDKSIKDSKLEELMALEYEEIEMSLKYGEWSYNLNEEGVKEAIMFTARLYTLNYEKPVDVEDLLEYAKKYDFGWFETTEEKKYWLYNDYVGRLLKENDSLSKK